jgi:hypothetical protein
MSDLFTPGAAVTTVVEPIKVVADIIQSELGLPDGAVMVVNQRWAIPSNQDLYVALAYVGPAKTIGNVNYFDSEAESEVQETSKAHMVQIDIMSFGDTARTRKEEVEMALLSMYSQFQQGKNLIKIARQPGPLVDASTLEATGRLNRFLMTVMVNALHRKVKAAAYYNKFSSPEVNLNE